VQGYCFRVVSPDAFAQEKLRATQASGADSEIVSSEDSEITGALIRGMIEQAEAITLEQESYATDQFNSQDSLVGYARIGRELFQQPPGIAVFCAAVGTADRIRGVASELRTLQVRARVAGSRLI
jgi:cysteine synthase